MAANNITDSHDTAPLLYPGAEFNSPKRSSELGLVYQAGFEAGFAQGKETGLKEAGSAAAAAVMCAAKDNVTPSVQVGAEPHRYLVGLPCWTCGAYYASDESCCPACKTSKVTLVTGLW
jgi:hypothetical protein